MRVFLVFVSLLLLGCSSKVVENCDIPQYDSLVWYTFGYKLEIIPASGCTGKLLITETDNSTSKSCLLNSNFMREGEFEIDFATSTIHLPELNLNYDFIVLGASQIVKLYSKQLSEPYYLFSCNTKLDEDFLKKNLVVDTNFYLGNIYAVNNELKMPSFQRYTMSLRDVWSNVYKKTNNNYTVALTLNQNKVLTEIQFNASYIKNAQLLQELNRDFRFIQDSLDIKGIESMCMNGIEYEWILANRYRVNFTNNKKGDIVGVPIKEDCSLIITDIDAQKISALQYVYTSTHPDCLNSPLLGKKESMEFCIE